VAGRDRPAAYRQRRDVQRIDAEMVQRCADADYVDDGVMTAELVQVHRFLVDAVQPGFGPGKRSHRGSRRCRNRGGHGPADQINQLLGTPLRIVGSADVDARRAQPVVDDLLHVQLPTGQSRRGDRRAHLAERCACVEQRSQKHVTGKTCERVEHADHRRATAMANRCAAIAAPNPESMFTTVIPAAQLDSIASNAVTPSSAAP
jgi:hypothetical protein